MARFHRGSPSCRFRFAERDIQSALKAQYSLPSSLIPGPCPSVLEASGSRSIARDGAISIVNRLELWFGSCGWRLTYWINCKRKGWFRARCTKQFGNVCNSTPPSIHLRKTKIKKLQPRGCHIHRMRARFRKRFHRDTPCCWQRRMGSNGWSACNGPSILPTYLIALSVHLC